MDQQARHRGGRTLNSNTGCLIRLDRLRWLNRIEPQFTGLRYFALDGTDHRSHAKQGQTIRRYISWRNRNACDPDLRRVVDKANVC